MTNACVLTHRDVVDVRVAVLPRVQQLLDGKRRRLTTLVPSHQTNTQSQYVRPTPDRISRKVTMSASSLS